MSNSHTCEKLQMDVKGQHWLRILTKWAWSSMNTCTSIHKGFNTGCDKKTNLMNNRGPTSFENWKILSTLTVQRVLSQFCEFHPTSVTLHGAIGSLILVGWRTEDTDFQVFNFPETHSPARGNEESRDKQWSDLPWYYAHNCVFTTKANIAI